MHKNEERSDHVSKFLTWIVINLEGTMNHFFPEILLAYLLPFRQAFFQPGWQYFQGYIWALLVSGGRKCVTQIARTCFFVDRSLASWERFLAEQQWDMTHVMQSLVGLLQQELGETGKYAGRYVIGVDPTYIAKVKGRMAGVQRWREHSPNPDRQTQVTGHQWMLGGLLAKLGQQWRCFPVWSRLVSGKQNPSHFEVSPRGEVQPMVIWDTALAVVLQSQAMLTGAALCAVMDAYFAKACMFNALKEAGVTLMTRLRHDAVGWDDPVYCGRGRPPERGQKWRLADLWQVGSHETITAHLYGKLVEVSVVVRDVGVRDVTEKVRIVVVEGVKRPFLLACTDLTMTAQQILELYAARFSLELAIRDLKGFFGLGDYQATTTLAFCRFVLLSCVACCLGRLLLHHGHVEAWLSERTNAPVSETCSSFARLRRGLRGVVLKQFIFSKFPSDADCEKLQEEFRPLFQMAA
jgi:hypothetical protein